MTPLIVSDSDGWQMLPAETSIQLNDQCGSDFYMLRIMLKLYDNR